MYKIDIKDEYEQYIIEDMLNRYRKNLNKDLLKLLRKLKETKPDTITNKERELILHNQLFYDSIQDSLGDLFRSIEEKEDEEDEDED
jgi:hypothetical protein